MLIRVVKKFVSLFASAIVVLVISGFVRLEPISVPSQVYARHTENPPCRDITMFPAGRAGTDAVPSPSSDFRNGSTDSGQMDFDAFAHQYQSCLEENVRTRSLSRQGGTIQVAGRFASGWANNTNFGRVSFSCENGVNSGTACGGKNYGVVVQDAPNADYKVRGFAWSDAIGWISLGCDAGMNLGAACSGAYGVAAARADDPAGAFRRGDLFGAGWNATVGWISFKGAHMDISAPIGTITADVTVKKYGADGQLKPIVTANRLSANANIADYYEVSFTVRENGAVIMPADANRQVTIQLTPSENTVRADQVTPCGGNACKYDAVSGWGDVRTVADRFYVRITSSAPTNAANRFSIGTSTITVRNPAANTVASAQVAIPNGAFEFTPPIDITAVAPVNDNGTPVPGAALETIPNGTREIDIQVARKAPLLPVPETNVAIHTQLYDCSNMYNFVFDDPAVEEDKGMDEQHRANPIFPFYPRANTCPQGTAGVGLTDVDSATLDTVDPQRSARRVAVLTTHQNAAAPSAEIVARKSAGIATLVHITHADGVTVSRYFGASLTESSILNQAAQIQGNVGLNIVDSRGLPTNEQISSTLGEKAASKREIYTRAARALLTGKQPRAFEDMGEVKTVTISADEFEALKVMEGVIYFKNPAGSARACTIILRNPAAGPREDYVVNRDYTIISEGCNVFIDQNIRGGNGKIAFIALEDLRVRVAPGIPADRGGSIFICDKVTDVDANFVADGSIFSYVTPTDECGGNVKSAFVAWGRPILPDNGRELLKHQLTLGGSFVSNNTYGGSLQTPALMGDGRRAATPAQQAESRIFDLNFLRYANVEELEGIGTCWADGVILSKSIYDATGKEGWPIEDLCSDQADAGAGPDSSSVVILKYRSPAVSQPIFGKIK